MIACLWGQKHMPPQKKSQHSKRKHPRKKVENMIKKKQKNNYKRQGK